MPDFAQPSDVMWSNPYLMPAPQPDKLSVLANILTGLGAGMSNAAASGRSEWAGIGPGAMLANQLIGNDAASAQKRQQQAAQFAMMADYRRTQEDAMREKMRMAQDAEKRDAAFAQSVAAALGGGFNVSGDPLAAFKAGIANNESGGRYDALGPEVPGQGRAVGKYQVMPANVAPWTKEILGTEMTPEQFIASPDAQEKVFAGKFGQYVQKYGPEGAAKAWFAGEGGMNNPNAKDVNGMTVAQYGQNFLKGAGMAQGGGEGQPSPQSFLAQLQPEQRALLQALAIKDPKEAVKQALTMASNQKKDDAWYPLGKDDVKMFLGPDADPKQGYQRNRVTGEIKGIGGALVNINQEQEKKVAQQIGEQDAKRVGEIQANEDRTRDLSSKVRMATDLLKNTYNGPMGEWNQAFLKSLGALGVEGAKEKASLAEAGNAIISQLMPGMRAPGSGATSDFEMRTFANALPSLSNLPNGNELIAQYFERIADRASAIRDIAERHITEKKGLTGTGYADEVKKLGPLFTKEELAQMQEVSKGGKPAGDRPPLQTFGGPTQGMTPMPGQQRPPLSSFGR